MTPSDLKRWQGVMGFTQLEASYALGVSLSTYKDWLRGICRTTKRPISIDRRTELACIALLLGHTKINF